MASRLPQPVAWTRQDTDINSDKLKRVRSILTPTGHIELQNLLNSTPARLVGRRDGESLLCELNGIHYWLETSEEALILQEIFTEKDYEVLLDRKFIAIDIGMNAGFTSLYLASHPLCKAVYGFEPISRTFETALKNFQLNPSLAQKIHPYSFGLAENDRQVSIEYSPLAKGMTNVYGLHPSLRSQGDIITEQIELRDAAIQLGQILEANSETLIFLKIDCEGAEYEILTHLEKYGLLSKIDQIAIEWHFKGAEPIEDVLSFICWNPRALVLNGYLGELFSIS